jgi:hypothetical protein
MDRISALRNVEEALSDFEAGEASLGDTERRVLATLRTYATEFRDDGLAAYRVEPAAADEPAPVVVADSPRAARQRAAELVDCDPIGVERLSDD